MAADNLRLDVVGIGSMVADLLYRAPRIIGPDEKIILTRHSGDDMPGPIVQRVVGGVTLNHLSWARVLGLSVGVVGKQADDDNGRFLRAGMDAIGIERHIRLDGATSSFAHIFIGERGERAIYMAPGDTADTTPLDISAHFAPTLHRARIISTEISQLPLPAVLAVLTMAHDAGIPTVLDVDVPMSDAIATLGTEEEFHEALSLATYMKPAAAACPELVPENVMGQVTKQGYLVAAEFLRGRYDCDAVVITDGEQGCVVDAESFQGAVAPPQITPVDTTGAGDAFLGGMIAGLRWELAWPDIAALANACGATCCERVGAAPDAATSCARVRELYNGAATPMLERAKTTETVPAAGDAPPAYADALAKYLDTIPNELAALRRRLKNSQLTEAVELILERESKGGRVHVTGTGKCEHVAKYAASLFSSTGTPAYFLHATETTHGSAGQARPGDVVIAISNSGATKETNEAVIALVQNGAHVIAVTKARDTHLGRIAHVVIEVGAVAEGGPLGLAPRGSVAAEVYVLAAVSVALQAQKGVSLPLYHSWHPAGALGRQSGGTT